MPSLGELLPNIEELPSGLSSPLKGGEKKVQPAPEAASSKNVAEAAVDSPVVALRQEPVTMKTTGADSPETHKKESLTDRNSATWSSTVIGGAKTRGQENLNVGNAPSNDSATSIGIVGKSPTLDQTPEKISGAPPEGDSRRFLLDRLFHLMTLKELNDKQSSWHPVGRFRIYLSAQHRYYGLPQPAEALPIWIYEGELAPEFLDEKESWKFYDRLPVSANDLESLPLEILEFIYGVAGKPVPEDLRLTATNRAALETTSPLLPTQESPSHQTLEMRQKKNRPMSRWESFVSFFKKLLGL